MPLQVIVNIVLANSGLLGTTQVLTESSNGYILAEDIHAPIDLPPFDNSAVDGYAIRFDDFKNQIYNSKSSNKTKYGYIDYFWLSIVCSSSK